MEFTVLRVFNAQTGKGGCPVQRCWLSTARGAGGGRTSSDSDQAQKAGGAGAVDQPSSDHALPGPSLGEKQRHPGGVPRWPPAVSALCLALLATLVASSPVIEISLLLSELTFPPLIQSGITSPFNLGNKRPAAEPAAPD